MHNTGNPLGSTQVLDLYDNSEAIDQYVNSQEDSFPDRFGTKRLTLAGLIKRSMALRNEINDFSGALTFRPEWTDVPMNVSEGVGGEGGALNIQAEALGNRTEMNKVHSLETLRRSYAEAGYNLLDIPASFENGCVLTSTSDVVLHLVSGKAYSAPGPFPHIVNPNTNPLVGGFVDRSVELLRDILASKNGVDHVGYSSGMTVREKVDGIDYVRYPKCADYKGRLGYSDGAFSIECWGDSTMWGSVSNNASVQEPISPPVALDLVLYGIYRENKPSVVNKAIPGTSLNSMIKGLHLYPRTFDEEMANSTASIVYCNHAHNDCYSGGSTPSQFKENLIKFVEICRKYGKVPVLVTPNVTNYSVTGSGISTIRYGSYVDEIRNVAKSLDVDLVDIYKYTESTARSVSMMEIVPDGGHPSAKGYQYIGATLALPLITTIKLEKIGDGGSLPICTYFDNITNDRQFLNSTNRLGKNLSGTIDATVQRVNIPVLLDSPTDDSFVAIAYENSGVGGYAQFLHNDQFRSDYSGVIWYESGVPSKDVFAAGTCELWAGVSLIGIITGEGLLPPAGGNFNISGVKLLKRTAHISPTPFYDNTHRHERPIIAGDTIDFVASIDASQPLQVLFVLVSTYNNAPWLTIKSELGVIKATTTNSTTIIGTASTDVFAAKVELLSNSAIKVTVGGLVVQLPDVAEAINNSFLGYNQTENQCAFVYR